MTFANNLQLNMVLPPEPRKYWVELADEHKKAPEHLAWQYMADPFAARKLVDERQEKARARQEEREAQADSESSEVGSLKPGARASTSNPSKAFQNAPEVRMAQSLRESVENAIKSSDPKPSQEAAIDVETLSKQLATLGFNQHAIKPAISLLTRPPPYEPYLASLKELPDLDAALTHLLMTMNESELPKAFLDRKGKGNTGGFVSSLHSGHSSEDLETRWIRERATKEVGWPERAVGECLSRSKDWGMLMEALGKKLIGLELPTDMEEELNQVDSSLDLEERDIIRQGEIEAVLSVHPDASVKDQTLSIPIPDSSLTLHVIYPPDHPYPHPGSQAALGLFRVPPIYITSPKTPPYVRLHVLSQILGSLYKPLESDGSLYEVLETGQGIVFAVIDFTSSVWTALEQANPPDLSEVMKHLLPPPDPQSPKLVPIASAPQVRAEAGSQPKKSKHSVDRRTAEAVLNDFESLRSKPEYQAFLDQRQKLPAWAAQENIIRTVERHRVTIIVGETGCGKTTQLPQFILDHLITSRRGKTASILVTQPRRVSALGVSARVSAERLDDGSVGYAIRGDSKVTAKTKLLFVTTGVALRRLATDEDQSLNDVTHIIVDEVHERSVDSDFLLLELRELLHRNRTIKIILMSATINQKTFVDYFGGAPVIEIPGFTHPVRDLYLEDLLQVVSYRPASRRGRAGRTQPGECYKLYTKKQEESMINFPIPEILRVPLDALSLQVKAAREDEDVTMFLAKAIDPPKVEAMNEAWRTLENLGAIDAEGKLTALGRYMSLLPLDLRLAKMLILGAVFRCLDPVLTAAAALSSKPLFYSPNEQRDEAKQARQRFSTGNSDLLTDAKAYEKCMALRSSGRSAQQRFCDANFISPATVRELTSLRADFHSALAGIGFVPINSNPTDVSLNTHSTNENLVKSVICGGLWPRVAMVSTPKQLFDKVQAGTVEREREAKEYKLFERGERVFVHPQSVMFEGVGSHKSPFFAYFSKNMTSKVFLRDVTE
ncbi:hypothetical protein FRB90_004651, partial [Tulasnella sp. 427]